MSNCRYLLEYEVDKHYTRTITELSHLSDVMAIVDQRVQVHIPIYDYEEVGILHNDPAHTKYKLQFRLCNSRYIITCYEESKNG